MIKHIALVAGFCLITPLLFAREISGENESFIPSIQLDETNPEDQVFFIDNSGINQCQFIHQACVTGQNQYLTLNPLKSIELSTIQNQLDDLIDRTRSTTFHSQKNLLLPEQIHDPVGEASSLAFSLNHLNERKNTETNYVFFINKPTLNNCQTINKSCNPKTTPALQEIPSNEFSEINSLLNTLFNEDIFARSTPLLPTNLEEPAAENGDYLFSFSDNPQRIALGAEQVRFIPHGALKVCRAIDQQCPFKHKIVPVIAGSERAQSLIYSLSKELKDTQIFKGVLKEVYIQQTAIVPQSFIPPIIDVGFILQPKPAKPVVSYVNSIRSPLNQRELINFDGYDLIYFDPAETLTTITRSRASKTKLYSKNSVKFSGGRRILMDKSAKNAILNNLINTKGIVEANHISVIENRIVLNNKSKLIQNIPEKKYYLNQTLYTLKTQGQSPNRDDLRSTQWVRKRSFEF